MVHKLKPHERKAVLECFGDSEIWTQEDITEITKLPQGIVSIGLNKLEDEGIICWIYRTGCWFCKMPKKLYASIKQ